MALLYFADSHLVLHVWDNFKVCFWLLYYASAGIFLNVGISFKSLCIFCSYYDTKAVLLAMGITAVVCIAVTIFCFQTKVRRWEMKTVTFCSSVARSLSEGAFVVSVKERLCLTLQCATEFL